MPFKFTFDSAQGFIYKRVSGVYDDDEAAAAIVQLTTFAEYEKVDELHDLRDVSEYKLTAAFLKRLGGASARSRADRELPEKRVAYVVSTVLWYGPHLQSLRRFPD